MNKAQLNKLTEMLDPAIWKDPKRSIKKLSKYLKAQDPRELAHIILRQGDAVPKEEKKYYGIHASAKVCESVFDHFIEEGLSGCVKATTDLACAVSCIEMELSKIKDWHKWDISKFKFTPAPDACPICKKLEGIYGFKEVPIPVLDTHLECRCSICPDESD